MTAIVERPPTEAELVAVIRQAAAQGRPVRAVGRAPGKRRHGGDEIILDLSDYGRSLRIDRDNGTATVQAGMSVRRLGTILGSWGLSLENGCRSPGQSLGAAVSLGAHGTAAALGGVATQVTGLRLVTPDGTVVSCSAAEEPDIFDAARSGLGALGIISTVTLRCQPGFNLRSHVVAVDIGEALARFDTDAANNDHLELTWLPGARRARIITANRTDEAADGGAVDRSYRWWNRRRVWPPQVEYSVRSTESASALRRAQVLSAHRHRGLPFPIEVTVAAGDDIPLSPAEGRPSVFIAGVAGLDGRPQWGSAHGLSPSAMRALYPRWPEWQAARDRLDPGRRFAHTSGQG